MTMMMTMMTMMMIMMTMMMTMMITMMMTTREWPSQRGRCLCPQVVVPPSPPSFDPLLEVAPAGDDGDDDDGDDGDDYGDDDDDFGDDDDDDEWLLLSKSILCGETWMRKPISNYATKIFPINNFLQFSNCTKDKFGQWVTGLYMERL